MTEEYQPDPDELLKAVQKEESREGSGKLKIFFGMAAGVGKTYAMLEEAQQLLKEGENVVVGTINTHGRKETEELLIGLPIIPEKWVNYKDTVFEELDLEKILNMKPKLVLVDELAHSNVPGSKHPKRWQDVLEILDAGIDVYTTLNVQHLESRKDIVESISGILVRETVPDLILERADIIELVDLSPQELLQRLKEGKVYLGDQSVIAIQNFFKEETLTALRDLALRFTAEKVEHDLHDILSQGKGWPTREKLMVAISPSPYSEQLIRSTRRRAFELDAPWIAVYVDRGQTLNDEDQKRLNHHLNLVRELGGEPITTYDLDIPIALKRIAKQKSITQIVIGRPTQKWSLNQLFTTSLLDRLEKQTRYLDILILRQDHVGEKLESIYSPPLTLRSPLRSYGLALISWILFTPLGYLLSNFVGYKSIGFLYLVGIIFLSFFVGRGPILLAATLSTLTWAFLFIPPLYDFSVSDPEDLALLIVYFLTAAFIGMMARRAMERDQLLRMREERIEHLYEIEKEIADCTDYDNLRDNASTLLKNILPGEFDILRTDQDGKLTQSLLPIADQEKEKAVAAWVLKTGKIAGRYTDTLPSSEAIYFPIKSMNSMIGVLIYYPKTDRPLSMTEMNFLQTVAQLIGARLTRYLTDEKTKGQIYTRQVEKLHAAILHSVSKGFYTPLTRIAEVTQKLRGTKAPQEVTKLHKDVENASKNLKLIVDNMLAISELESGFVRFEKKRQQVTPLIQECVSEVKQMFSENNVQIEAPESKIYFSFDFQLMKIALNNVLSNAIVNSPDNSTIFVNVQIQKHECVLSVSDEGPGIPTDVLPMIFEKFYRIPGSPTKGIGLGLAVVKSIIDIHQGHIEVKKRGENGTDFCMILPL